MPLLPRADLLVNFPLSAPEVSARLAAAVEPARPLPTSSPEHVFEGWVREERFEIRRIDKRHLLVRGISPVPATPTIAGTVEPTPTGSRIRATVSVHPATAGFMGLWFALAVLLGGGYILSGASSGFQWTHLMPLVILVGGGVSMRTSFTDEVGKARELLFQVTRASAAPRASRIG